MDKDTRIAMALIIGGALAIAAMALVFFGVVAKLAQMAGVDGSARFYIAFLIVTFIDKTLDLWGDWREIDK